MCGDGSPVSVMIDALEAHAAPSTPLWGSAAVQSLNCQCVCVCECACMYLEKGNTHTHVRKSQIYMHKNTCTYATPHLHKTTLLTHIIHILQFVANIQELLLKQDFKSTTFTCNGILLQCCIIIVTKVNNKVNFPYTTAKTHTWEGAEKTHGHM